MTAEQTGTIRRGAAWLAASLWLLTTVGVAAPRTVLGPAGAPRRAQAPAGPPAPAPAPAQPIVAAVDIQPVRYESLVRDTMRTKVGEPFDAQTLQNDVNALFELGWFKFAGPGETGGSLVTQVLNAAGETVVNVNLVENPLVAAIVFHGVEPAQQPTAEQMANDVGYLRAGWPLNTNREKVDRALLAIERVYRDQLGLEAKVALLPAETAPGPTELTADGQVNVHLAVTLGAPAAEQPAAPPADPADPAAPAGEQPAAPTADPAVADPAAPAGEEPAAPTGEEPAAAEAPPGTPLAVPDLRMRINKIEIRGLQTVSEGLVRETITTREGQLYDRAKVQADIDKINELSYFYFRADRELLQDIGYPLPPVTEAGSRVEPLQDPDGQGLTLVFQLVEHPTIKEIVISGNTLISTEELTSKLVNLVVGRAFKAQATALERDLIRISDIYREQGHLVSVQHGADGQPLLTAVEGGVRVALTILEYKVGDVTFNYLGKRKTQERVFRATMRTRPGEVYNYNKINEDLREIQRLDIVETLVMQEPKVDPNDPSRLNLTFDVTEKRTLNLGAGGGISSRYGIVGFVDATEANLFGRAQRVSLRLEAGGRFNADASYFLPLLDGQGTEFSARLYNTDDKTGASGLGSFTNRRQTFDQTRRGANLNVSRPLGPGLRLSVGYRFENVTTERRGALLPTMPPFPFQDVGSDSSSSIILGLVRDVRDYPLDATRGSFLSGSLEYAGLGGDNNFQKYRLEARKYMAVLGGKVKSGRREPRPAWVLATRAQVSVSTGRLPFSQSYFIGGADTLRGYTEDRFFGNRAFLFNFELRRALPNNIQLVGFFDAGRAWRQGEPLDFFSNLASSIGVGARVATPLGPVRLDYGWGGDGSKLHFSFGQAF